MSLLTGGQLRRAQRLRDAGYRIAAIATVIGAKAEDIDRELNWSAGLAANANAPVLAAGTDRPQQGFGRLIWTDEKWTLAQAMHADGDSFFKIAKAVRLKQSQVENKFHNEHMARQAAAKREREAPAMIEREHRAEAARRQTLTQFIFGDPPPGYSALDMKRKGITP